MYTAQMYPVAGDTDRWPASETSANIVAQRFRLCSCRFGLLLRLTLASFPVIAAAQISPQGPVRNSSDFHLIEATIDDIHAAMRSGRLTCRVLVDGYMRRIEA